MARDGAVSEGDNEAQNRTTVSQILRHRGWGGVLLKDMEPHVLEALGRFLKERKLCSSTGALSWENVNMRQLPTILEFV